ncbi:MAG: exodeoxyribonuclease V subunit gamma [Candidatus Rokubacteria bacterium]|nr:exodeoxyribonuclease V subunit gamma [Candidatus Rokubacteria bacterium]
MFDVIRASAATERLAAASAFVERFPPATELLIIGATRDAADDFARRLTAARGATFGLHCASLLQLAVRCAADEMARRGMAPGSGLGAEALAARVSFEAARERALPYFMPVARFPGFAAALAATLAELRLARVGPAALDKGDSAARDVAELLRRFEGQLDDARIADRAALLLLAARAVVESPLRRMPMVLLDVPVAEPAAAAFVDALTAVSPAVLVTVPSGDDATVETVREMAARRGGGLTIADDTERDDSDLGRARGFLFAPAVPPSRAASGEAVLFSAPGEARETVDIARRLLDEARTGTRFDDMAVLLRAPEMYGSLLQAALERAGVPAYFARGTARPDPSGRAFLALLDCALERLSAQRFAEYLSLGQVPPLDATGAPPTDRAVWVAPDDETLGPAADTQSDVPEPPADQPDADDQPVVDGTLRAPWKWEQLLVESAVIGGQERWARRLNGLEAEYRLKLAEARATEPDAPRVAAIARDLANLEHLRRFALPVVERLAALPADGTWGEWSAALETLAPVVLRRPERVLTVLAALRPLDVIGPVALAEVRDVLAGELATLAVRPPADRYGRVFVGTIEQARGRTFDVVFVPGLAERIFPQKPREDALLLDTLRRQLAAPLATQTERAQRERLLLRLAVGAARSRLYLSYSRIEQTEARPRVPSFYALEMARALTGRVPDPEVMARDAAAAAGAPLAWPAPDDPARAIDGVEHDLATLRALLGGGRAHGRARYLFELNDCVMRSLRTQWARWQQPRFTPYDGIVRVADGTRDTLGAARLAARPYSASALQKFAACPYQFFLSAILRIEPRSEIESITRLDPMTRGHLFHRVQADAMRALAAEGRLPLTVDALDAARATLDRTLDAVADRYREDLAPAIRRVWQDEIDSMRADLQMWLGLTAASHATWEPVAFELAFGLRADEDNDPQSVEAEVTLDGGARLRGIVDLVERKRGGTDLRVTDYKTGGNWTKRGLVVGGGEQLQPVLYGLAMEQVLGARVAESRLFYCTRTGRFSEAVVPLTSDARSRGLAVLGVIDRAIAAGFLPPAPRHRACGICDFRAVCGPHEETRVTKKDAARIEELRELRDWP